jgi:BMFP domain-containing protein YqiC
MKKADFLQDLSARLAKALPKHLIEIKHDVEKNFQAVLQKAFAKFELVTREEFDSQAKVLARTRKKLEALELEVKELETLLHKKKSDE